MERLCFILRLMPNAGEEYDRRHREMWPELVELIRDSGMRRYTIFRRDELVVGYAECEPTFAATQDAAHDPDSVGERWQAYMADLLLEPIVTAPEVWHLD